MNMNPILDQIMVLSKLITTYIDKQNTTCVKRKYKTNMSDASSVPNGSGIFRMLYSNINSNQENVTASMNQYRLMHNMPIISRSSLIDREKKLKSGMLIDIYNIIDKYSKEICSTNKELPLAYVFIAADGTHTNANKTLSKNGYKMNKNEETCDILNLSLYNITYDFPEVMNVVKHKNEQKALIDILSSHDFDANFIFICDRFYWGNPIFYSFIDHKVNFICRLKSNSTLIDITQNDYIVQYKNTDLRIVSYIIESERYYLITNLLDKDVFTIKVMEILYHKRWSIEEFLKYMKTNTKLSKIYDKNEERLKKTIYSSLITAKLIHIMQNILPKHKNPNMIINKRLLTFGFYQTFILDMMYGYSNKTTLEGFFKIYFKYTHTQRGKKYEHKSITPFTKWYVKGRYVKKKIKKPKIT